MVGYQGWKRVRFVGRVEVVIKKVMSAMLTKDLFMTQLVFNSRRSDLVSNFISLRSCPTCFEKIMSMNGNYQYIQSTM